MKNFKRTNITDLKEEGFKNGKEGDRLGLDYFLLIIFWPVGLFLLIRKLATDKSALMSGKTGSLTVVALFLTIFGGLGFLGMLLDTSGDTEGVLGGAIIVIAMMVGGILLLRKASKTKKTAIRYKKYIDIVVNQDVRSLDNISSAVGLPYDVVAKDLQDMINIGYLKDAYINQGNREITLKQHESVIYTQVSVVGQVAAVQTKAVRCTGCGANNVVTVGKVSECEYCGTPINA